MTRRTIWLAGALAALEGCETAGDLGTVRVRDAGAELATPTTPLSCTEPGGDVGMRDEELAVAPAVPLTHDEPAHVGTAQTFRAGRAVNADGAIYWSVGDDRCGTSEPRMWWGVRMLQLSFDPDRAIRVNWTCLRNTYRALNTTMLRVGDQLGVFYLTHIEETTGVPNDYGYDLGTLTRPPMTFSSTQNALNTRRVTVAAFGDGAHIVYADNGGRRFYQRVDGALLAAGDAVPIEGELPPHLDEPRGVMPWGDAMLAFWNVEDREVIAEVFTETGQRRELWSINTRAGLREPVAMLDVQPVAGGAAALLRVGTGASGRSYFARFCDDGRWAMRRIGGTGTGGVLRRIGDRWIIVRAYTEDSGHVAGLIAVDDDGRRLGPPLVVDRALLLEIGDVAEIPATQDVVVLYTQQSATNDQWQLRATRVTRAE